MSNTEKPQADIERHLSTLSLVIPVFNESGNLCELVARVRKVLDHMQLDYKLIFVDDGSTDDTAAIINTLNQSDPRIAMISLSRNFGHQAAISAGLEFATGEAVVIMDGDLQDPPEILNKMIDLWKQGSDVVYAVRRKRKESLFNRAAYSLYYRILQRLSNVKIPLDSGDFSLLSSKVVQVICECKERSRFTRGIRSWAGFNQVALEYERDARFSGKTKYGFFKLWKLGMDGIFAFSITPLRLSIYLGLALIFISFIYIIYAIGARIMGGATPPGWASLIVAMLFMGSIQLLMIGIVGEYVARTYEETKQRPLFVIRQKLGIG